MELEVTFAGLKFLLSAVVFKLNIVKAVISFFTWILTIIEKFSIFTIYYWFFMTDSIVLKYADLSEILKYP